MDFLQTERIVLRQFTPDDHANLLDLDSDPEVMRHISHGTPSSLSEIDRAIGVILKTNQHNHHQLGYWVAEDKLSREFLGWFHLRPLKERPDDTEILELGYRLKKKTWGKGLATEGSRALMSYGFDERGAKEILAQTMIGNEASQKIMKKMGMSFREEFLYEPYPGEDKRSVWYGVTREQYANFLQTLAK